MKKLIVCVFILLLFPLALWGEQLTKIGVIDLSEIVSNYFRESKAFRELEDMTRRYEEEKEIILEEIEQLENERIEALNEDDEEKALELDEEIFEKKEYLKEYTRIKYNQIQKKRENLLESPTFLSEVLNVISYVAENEGYTMVFQAKDPNLMWWSKEVDITEKVLERLRRISDR